MADKYFALELVGGLGLSKTHQNCEGVTTVYVCSAEEHAENEQLRARIQELGQMVREVNTKRVVELQVEMQRIVTEHETAMNALDASMLEAITAAKAAGVPQGLIVALLHGHTHLQTQIMVERA